MTTKIKKAWIVTVDMGYGHQRAAHALKEIALEDHIIVANDYPGIPAHDRKLWERGRMTYERLSRLKSVPVIGKYFFSILDKIQEIPPLYPRRDLARASFQVKETYHLLEKKGLFKHLIQSLAKKNSAPIISTFFMTSMAAEVHDYPGDIYTVLCDADISRAWVARDPKKSRIKYFAPNGRVVERLKLYGVPDKNIFLTGFPIPKILVGDLKGSTVLEDLSRRLCKLDPKGIFHAKYHKTLNFYFGKNYCYYKVPAPYHITFAVGGAGAQKELGIRVARSLAQQIGNRYMSLTLVAGVRKEVEQYFLSRLIEYGLDKYLGKGLDILYTKTKEDYFNQFDTILRKTDILWTKPSELSFYTAAGIPIIMAQPIGSQEQFNHLWLEQVGGGLDQLDPQYADEWLNDWIQSGGLARMAWSGYIEAPTHGVYRINDVLQGKKSEELEELPLIV